MTLRLTCAFSPNPRLRPLMEGAVKPKNIELEFVTTGPSELFFRNLKYDEFEVSEMSISETFLARERSGGTRWDWAGLPVFLSKALLWVNLYAHAESRIEHLGDLRGKRVGIPDYSMTAALWMREVLKELHSIEAKDIMWYNGRTKELSHGGILGLDEDPPPGVTLNWLTEDQTMDGMVEQGELDAAIIPRVGPADGASFATIDRYGGTPLADNPRVRPLLRDGGREVVIEYFRRTGIVPTNHMVIVQNRIFRDHSWAALELYEAFQRSKEIAYQEARRATSAYLLFEGEDFQRQAAVFGDDPYPLGIRANRRMLERLIRSSLDQGLLRKPARIEDVFYRTVLDT